MDVERGGRGRNGNMKRSDIDRVAPPGNCLATRLNFQAGKLLNDARWGMIARDPHGIEQDQLAFLYSLLRNRHCLMDGHDVVGRVGRIHSNGQSTRERFVLRIRDGGRERKRFWLRLGKGWGNQAAERSQCHQKAHTHHKEGSDL